MKLLLLDGTSEARRLAALLAKTPGIEAVASLAGVTAAPRPLALPTRIGGFGGEVEQEIYMINNEYDVVIDATHPFAARIGPRSRAICVRRGIAYLRLLRPAWRPGPGERWATVAGAAEARAHIPPGARVFLATGPGRLPGFANLADCHLVCRRIDPDGPAFPWPNGEYVTGRPPFTQDSERALFAAHRIGWLVAKNSGGTGGRAKLDAARDLGIGVVMIARPPEEPGDRVETPRAAMDWLRARM